MNVIERVVTLLLASTELLVVVLAMASFFGLGQ